MGFKINCLVKKVNKNYKGGKSGSQLNADVFMLIPLQSDQMTLFFDLWLPTDKYKKPETPVTLPNPVGGAGHVQVCLKDEWSDGQNYLHVMSPSLEARLSAFVGRNVMVEVPDEGEEIDTEE